MEGLRADAVGAFSGSATSGTHHLDRLAERSELATRAVSPSSWSVPVLASVATGLRPWQHQAVSPEQARLADRVTTLAELLAGRGYATAAFGEGRWFDRRHGHAQGFARFQALRSGKPAERYLRSLDGGRDFVWIQWPEPAPPFEGRESQVLESIDLPELAPYYEGEVELPEELALLLTRLYRAEVTSVDQRIGRLLRALEESGQRERTLLVVASLHGQELGESGRLLSGGSLARATIEVPLWIDLPEGWERSLAPSAQARVSLARLHATLAEAAGATPAPGTAPSLFTVADEGPILSELYAHSGANLYSLLDGDLQLLYEARFATTGPRAKAARPFRIDARPGLSPVDVPLGELARLRRLFEAWLPLAGRAPSPFVSLYRWSDEGAEPVDDPAEQARRVEELYRVWSRFAGMQRAPAREAFLRSNSSSD